VHTHRHFICLTGHFRKVIVRSSWVAKWVAALKRSQKLFNTLEGFARISCCTLPNLSKQTWFSEESFYFSSRESCRLHGRWNPWLTKRFWGTDLMHLDCLPFCAWEQNIETDSCLLQKMILDALFSTTQPRIHSLVENVTKDQKSHWSLSRSLPCVVDANTK